MFKINSEHRLPTVKSLSLWSQEHCNYYQLYFSILFLQASKTGQVEDQISTLMNLFEFCFDFPPYCLEQALSTIVILMMIMMTTRMIVVLFLRLALGVCLVKPFKIYNSFSLFAPGYPRLPHLHHQWSLINDHDQNILMIDLLPHYQSCVLSRPQRVAVFYFESSSSRVVIKSPSTESGSE